MIIFPQKPHHHHHFVEAGHSYGGGLESYGGGGASYGGGGASYGGGGASYGGGGHEMVTYEAAKGGEAAEYGASNLIRMLNRNQRPLSMSGSENRPVIINAAGSGMGGMDSTYDLSVRSLFLYFHFCTLDSFIFGTLDSFVFDTLKLTHIPCFSPMDPVTIDHHTLEDCPHKNNQILVFDSLHFETNKFFPDSLK